MFEQASVSREEAPEEVGSGPEGGDRGLPQSRRDRRWLWLGLTALVLAVATETALEQQPWGDPYDPPRFSTLDWFLHPLERHPEQRLPIVAGEIHDVGEAPDGAVWAVGSGGLVLRREAGGREWDPVDLAQRVPRPEQEGAPSQASRFPVVLPGGTALAQASTPPDPRQQQMSPSQQAIRSPKEREGIIDISALQPDPVGFRYLKPGWTDRGTFEPVLRTPVPNLHAVQFLESGHGWIGGGEGALFFTEDGGRSWLERKRESATNEPAPTLRDLAFTSPRTGCLLLQGRTEWMVATTTDGGLSWFVVEATSASAVHAHEDGCSLLSRPGASSEDSPLITTTSTVAKAIVVPPGSPTVEVVNGVDAALLPDGELVTMIGGELVDRPSPGGGELSQVAVGAAGELWVADVRGRLWKSRDAGQFWAAAGTLPVPSATLAPMSDGDLLTVLPAGGMAVSRDGGYRWTLETRRADRKTFTSLAFLDRRTGVAGGWGADGAGLIWATRDEGRSWSTVMDGMEDPVGSVGFVDGSFGWAVRDGDVPIYTTDGGETWQERSTSWSGRPPRAIRSLRFLDRQTGFFLDEEGSIHETFDGGSSWERTQLDHYLEEGDSPEAVDLLVLGEQNRRLALVLDRAGQLHLVRDGGGEKLGPHVPGATAFLRRGDHLWLGGPAGLYRARLSIPGVAFEPRDDVPTCPGCDLTGVERVFRTPVAGFDVLPDGTVYAAEPGGGLMRLDIDDGTVHDLTPYRFYPAPWYYLAAALALLLLVPAIAPPPPREVRRSVAEMAVSDRPIQLGDPDPLGFRDVALGLSRFLRNSATRPPLTVAVTGEWGTGKSSLMNLLHADLERYGFRPVWFNAWHHQKEEHLLAALLENIRAQAIPSWLRPEGWAFRARLLGKRLGRWWWFALLLVVSFGLFTGWVAAAEDQMGALTSVLSSLDWAIHWLNPASWFAGDGADAPVEAPATPVVALLISGAGVLVTLARGLRAFGLKPGKLVAGLSERARLRDAQAQAGFRYRFAREFEDVTEALAPRTLTVLIDDLDRCRPQNVLDVLEAVNFLVSSGDCYVVLGIDRERVERCVGFSFKDVAEEILDQGVDEVGDGEGESQRDGRLRRAHFARQYMEKLINIEVPVPQTTAKGGLALLRPRARPQEPRTTWARLVDGVREITERWWLLPAFLPLALFIGLWIGGLQGTPRQLSANAGEVPMVAGDAPAGNTMEELSAPTAEVGDVVSAEDAATPPPAGTGREASAFHRGQPAERPHLWLWGLALLVVLGVGIWVLSTVPQVQVHDSDEFRYALGRWFPLLYADRPTPRNMKRFLNRVRWYAMRQREAQEPRPLYADLLARLSRLWTRLHAVGARGEEPRDGTAADEERVEGIPTAEGAGKPATDGDEIPEQVLVALASVQQTHPEWLDDREFWQSPSSHLAELIREKLATGPKAVALDLHDLQIWLSRQDALQLADHRERFLRLSQGIETH